MRRSRLIWLSLLLVAVMIAGACSHVVFCKLFVSNYDRVKVGMTFDEVVAVFGREPDSVNVTLQITYYRWYVYNGTISVSFQEDGDVGKVTGRHFYEKNPFSLFIERHILNQ